MCRPGASMRGGRITVNNTRKKRIPVVCRGRGPRTPAVPGFCALFVRSPRRAGGLFALVPFAYAGRKGRSLRSLPATRVPPLRPSSLPALRARPLRRCRWGGGVGAVPASLGALPARLPPLPAAGGGWLPSFAVSFCGGVPWLFPFRLLLRWCVPPAPGLRRGRVPRWAFRSARRPAPCPGVSRSCGFPARLPPGVSPFRGVAGCRRRVAAVAFAPCRVGSRSLFRLRRRRSRSVAVAPRGCWPPVSRWLVPPLSRVGAFPFPRRRLGGGRVFGWSPAVAGVPPAGVGGGFLGAGRWPFGRGRLCGWR